MTAPAVPPDYGKVDLHAPGHRTLQPVDVVTALQQLVDAMLAQARREHPGVEFSIVLSNANSLLLPMDADQLDRARDGVPGFYRGHVYRDALVESTPSGPDLDITAWLSPVQGTGAESAPLYRVDLDSGEISTVGRNTI